MTQASRRRFAEVVREEHVDVALACMLIGCEWAPDLDVPAELTALDGLAERIGPVPPGAHPAALLREGLGVQGGFQGTAADYEDVRSSLLPEVLRRRRGLPILLSVVWCEVAARLDVAAVPLDLPGHVMVLVGGDTVVDPFAGGAPVSLPVASPPVLDAVPLLLRVLTNIRVLGARQPRSLESARTRLWATELSLLLPHHPLALRRERGELLVRLGDYAGGAEELHAYAELVADPGESDLAQRQARLARSRLN